MGAGQVEQRSAVCSHFKSTSMVQLRELSDPILQQRKQADSLSKLPKQSWAPTLPSEHCPGF